MGFRWDEHERREQGDLPLYVSTPPPALPEPWSWPPRRAIRLSSPSTHRPLPLRRQRGRRLRGQKRGAVSAFAIDRQTGDLTLLNQQPSGGAGPCHLTRGQGGQERPRRQLRRRQRRRPADRRGRQARHGDRLRSSTRAPASTRGGRKAPHAHSINLDAANRFAFAADLGLDKVLVYRFDAGKGTLTPNDPPTRSVAPAPARATSPSTPTASYAYVINEMDSTVTAFGYDAGEGRAQARCRRLDAAGRLRGQELPRPRSWSIPSGKFLYGSNRGHDSIAIFAIDAGSGRLTPIGHHPSGGKSPRNFTIDPSGGWMVVGNQGSDNVLILAVDPGAGHAVAQRRAVRRARTDLLSDGGGGGLTARTRAKRRATFRARGSNRSYRTYWTEARTEPDLAAWPTNPAFTSSASDWPLRSGFR